MSNQQQQQTKTLEIPKAEYPIVNRVITDHPFPTEPVQGVPVDPHRPAALIWNLGSPHPIVNNLKIVRMYVVPGISAEIYSASEDGKMGVRNAIPWPQIRVVEEVCDAESFVAEIVAAERDDDDDDDPDPEPAPTPLVALQPMPNGGVS